jgi:hypothetical protein
MPLQDAINCTIDLEGSHGLAPPHQKTKKKEREEKVSHGEIYQHIYLLYVMMLKVENNNDF